MSRSLNGNYLGQAARIARRDLQEQIDEARQKFNEELSAAMDALKRLDPNWSAWFDGRPEQTCGEMLPLIKERVEFLLNERDATLFDDVATQRMCAWFGTQL